jgi:hypothetical protein
MYNLSRKAYPIDKFNGKRDHLIRTFIDGVPMVSYRGYHAELALPNYSFVSKLGYRNNQSSDPSNWPDLKFDVEYFPVKVARRVAEPNKYTLGEHIYIWLSNNAKIDGDYYDYYKCKYPNATWLHTWQTYDPIKIMDNDKLVAVIMPVRTDK